MRFAKLHGYGNDYIVCTAAEFAAAAASDEAAFVRRVCDRHYGAGADGVATVEPLTDAAAASPATGGATALPSSSSSTATDGAADFRLRIFNPDGSEAAMSGNGSRAAAAFLHHEGLWARAALRFATRAGVKLYRLIEADGRGRYRFAAEIGRPRFEPANIPLQLDEELPRVVNYPLDLGDGERVSVTALEMCNPNCCVLVADFEAVDWRRWGRIIESHPRFPARTNVEFIRAVDRTQIEARVWERGVGETLSSGTGACAAAVAACVNDLTDRRVAVQMPGGRLEVEWRADGEVVLTGAAQVVYRGEWLQA
ncbi:MAG TPA: diaminopimelate epimerase [Pyrinomonadaceae bacterium]|jgi:diaminopimelate epimerase